jgi:hypothetical protein
VRRSSRRGIGGLDGWSHSTESGLQACYGKSLGNGAFSMGPIRRRLGRLAAAAGLTAVSVEPLGAVARRGLTGPTGYEPLRESEVPRPQATHDASSDEVPELRQTRLPLLERLGANAVAKGAPGSRAHSISELDAGEEVGPHLAALELEQELTMSVGQVGRAAKEVAGSLLRRLASGDREQDVAELPSFLRRCGVLGQSRVSLRSGIDFGQTDISRTCCCQSRQGKKRRTPVIRPPRDRKGPTA